MSLHKKPAGHNPGDEAGEAARSFTLVGGSAVPILVSALALIFSGASLYETVLKQAHLHVYVPDTIAYTRDPDGSFEVFALPVTVSNSGARDGIVTALKLQVRNAATGATQTLEASYFAGSDYFSTKEDVANNIRRSKTPFAPLSVTGRGSVTTTVLFYGRQYQEQRVVPGQGRYELLLTAEARPTEALGFLDALWASDIAPQRFVYELPQVSQYFEGRVLSGHSERMFRAQ
ncbi:MAG: hypothetical protein J2P50_10510 [Hyphomicrobiaceae bacterium]|nr:hypothetical protein [Hyphomicrobiaceae bacterium]